MSECTTCIMESRITHIEDRLDKQVNKFAESQAEAAGRMARMESNIELVLKGQGDINKKLSIVLEDRQNEAIEKARNSNKAAATKWNNLSSGTKGILKSIFLIIISAVVGYLIKAFIS